MTTYIAKAPKRRTHVLAKINLFDAWKVAHTVEGDPFSEGRVTAMQ